LGKGKVLRRGLAQRSRESDDKGLAGGKRKSLRIGEGDSCRDCYEPPFRGGGSKKESILARGRYVREGQKAFAERKRESALTFFKSKLRSAWRRRLGEGFQRRRKGRKTRKKSALLKKGESLAQECQGGLPGPTLNVQTWEGGTR